MSTEISEILRLPVADRIQLVEEIWDSIAEFPDSIALTDAQRDELDRRLRELDENPDEGIPWSELRRQILNAR